MRWTTRLLCTGPVLAGLGILGFIVGFALQDTLGNFAAGMMILIYRPFDVGDMIEAAGVFGKVSAMNLVSTTILTIDNQTLVVPNGRIWGDVIKNVTHQSRRRVDMTFGVSYTDDIPKTEKVLAEIVREHGGEVLVQSSLGRGSTFTLLLPSAPPNATPRGATAESPTSGLQPNAGELGPE